MRQYRIFKLVVIGLVALMIGALGVVAVDAIRKELREAYLEAKVEAAQRHLEYDELGVVDSEEGRDYVAARSSEGNSCSSNQKCKSGLDALCGTKGEGCVAVEPVYVHIMADGDSMCSNNDGCTGNSSHGCKTAVPFIICRKPKMGMW